MSSVKRKGLGRGLDALLGNSSRSVDTDGAPVIMPLSQMRPGKYQPRTRMDEGSLAELSESIRQQGIMQPILVRPIDDGLYEIIAGERRFRAATMAGLESVPVLVRHVPDESALVMALIENIQREDLSALEEAVGIKRLIDEFGMTHEQAAESLGRSRSGITNLLRLLNLTPAVQELLAAGDLEMGHARALLPLPGAQQVMAAQRIVQQRLSVREAEKLVQREQATQSDADQPKADKAKEAKSRDVLDLEEKLSDTLAMPVEIESGRKGAGQLVIRYSSLDQLDGLLARLLPDGSDR